MTKFNHAFDIAFEVISNCPEGSDVTNEMLKKALLKRIEDCTTGKDAELEHYTECANCETRFPDDDAHTSDHYEGSTCCDDCHNEMIDLHVRCKGDPYHDWRTY